MTPQETLTELQRRIEGKKIVDQVNPLLPEELMNIMKAHDDGINTALAEIEALKKEV